MQWKTKARLAAATFLTGAFLGANPALIGAGSVEVPARHEAATDAARLDVENFLAYTLTGGMKDAAILVSGMGWVTPVARHGGDALLVRTPEGAVLSAGFAGILDWGFTGPDGRLYGNYRARLLMAALPPDAAARLAATLSETPLPRAETLSANDRDFLLAAGGGSL